MAGNSTGAPPVGPITRWLILILASIGFAFDIYELLMLPLVGPDALVAMGMPRGSDNFKLWVALLFYVPALFGGVFGLMGGYLTDWLGRRRVLTWSILLYAISAFIAGYSTSPLMLLILRCGVFVGVCVEFVAAVAWLAELFPVAEEREKALGYTQAFSSVGGLLVAVAYGICKEYGELQELFPAIAMPSFLEPILGSIPELQQHAAWRYTLMSGLIPAIPLLVIRPFLPESPVWAQKKAAGTLKRPNVMELFTTPRLRTTTIVTTIMFACSYGAAFGAIQQMRNIIPGLQVVDNKVEKMLPNAIAEAKAEALKDGKEFGKKNETIVERRLINAVSGKINAEYTKVQEIGGLLGRFLLAILIVRIVSRRAVLRVFQVPGLFITPLVFYFFLTMDNTTFFEINLESIYLGTLPITTVSLGIFLVGLFTVGQFSFWGNYLPTVYPVHLRGTGESFAANVGGRLVGTSFAAVTVWLSTFMPRETFEEQMALAAAIVGGSVYLVGVICSFFLPEPTGEMDE